MTSFPEPIASILPFPSDGSCTDRLAHTSKPSLSVPFPSFEGHREIRICVAPSHPSHGVFRSRVYALQKPTRGFFQRLFKFLSCAFAHEINHAAEFLKCPTKFVTGLTK